MTTNIISLVHWLFLWFGLFRGFRQKVHIICKLLTAPMLLKMDHLGSTVYRVTFVHIE